MASEGTQGARLPAVTEDGRRFIARATLRQGQSEAPDLYAGSRAQLRKAQLTTDAKVRRSWQRLTTEVNRLRGRAEKNLPEGRMLPPDTARFIRGVIRDGVVRATRECGNAIEDGIRKGLRREMKAQVKALRDQGVKIPKAAVDAAIEAAVKSAMEVPFPGTDFSTQDRLRGLMGRGMSVFNPLFTVKSTEARGRAMERVRKQLHDPKPGKTRVSGGSLSKKIMRINRTEQARALREANLAILTAAGVEYAYWRLSPQHPWYGGNEICEKLAAGTGAGVVAELRDKGLTPKGGELRGLYRIGQFPRIPHPNCMCTQVPALFDKPGETE